MGLGPNYFHFGGIWPIFKGRTVLLVGQKVQPITVASSPPTWSFEWRRKFVPTRWPSSSNHWDFMDWVWKWPMTHLPNEISVIKNSKIINSYQFLFWLTNMGTWRHKDGQWLKYSKNKIHMTMAAMYSASPGSSTYTCLSCPYASPVHLKWQAMLISYHSMA